MDLENSALYSLGEFEYSDATGRLGSFLGDLLSYNVIFCLNIVSFQDKGNFHLTEKWLNISWPNTASLCDIYGSRRYD